MGGEKRNTHAATSRPEEDLGRLSLCAIDPDQHQPPQPWLCLTVNSACAGCPALFIGVCLLTGRNESRKPQRHRPSGGGLGQLGSRRWAGADLGPKLGQVIIPARKAPGHHKQGRHSHDWGLLS